MMPERTQRWQNQNQFLENRHGPDKAFSPPETIAVELSLDGDQAFDLLCWTINMAARPGDSIIAFGQREYDTMQKFIAGSTYKPQVISTRFKPLQDLCDVKNVHLEMRVASRDVAEKLLVEEIVATNCTMLVVTTTGISTRRYNAHRRGSFLCRQLPSGCSVVVVKDYKIMCYKENNFRGGPGSEQRAHQYSEEVAKKDQHDNSVLSCNELWPSMSTATFSPKRVLDTSAAFFDSEGSPSSSDQSGLTHLLPKNPSISCPTSSLGEQDAARKQHCICLSLSVWRGEGRACQFSPLTCASQSKHALLSAYYKSLKKVFKLCMRNLWIARPFKQGSPFILSRQYWRIFTYKEISTATNFFSAGNLVGKGGHSEVYKGVLSDGRDVAIKRLMQGNPEEQTTLDFLTELGMISHVLHPNIIPLVGYCIENGLNLIFRYLKHGNLASWLYGEKLPTLKWAIRYRVAVGTARGLNYLHCDCQRRIIHRDIKASNILLGPDFEPLISDFGLAKWLPDQCSHHVLTPIEGTFGYLAPEYVMNGIVDEKTDIFAFGVLLLELITGRKPIEGLESSLVMWARPFLETMSVEQLLDARLNGDYDPQEMQCMMMAAALCVQQSPQCRPCMSQVLHLLMDELISDGADSFSVLSSQSFCLQDGIFESDYSSTHYQDDLRRHKEIALEF